MVEELDGFVKNAGRVGNGWPWHRIAGQIGLGLKDTRVSAPTMADVSGAIGDQRMS